MCRLMVLMVLMGMLCGSRVCKERCFCVNGDCRTREVDRIQLWGNMRLPCAS